MKDFRGRRNGVPRLSKKGGRPRAQNQPRIPLVNLMEDCIPEAQLHRQAAVTKPEKWKQPCAHWCCLSDGNLRTVYQLEVTELTLGAPPLV